jgi:hypothetical protein
LVSDLDETTHYFAASGSTGLRIDDLQLHGTYRWTAHVQSAVRARRIGWWPSHRFELQFDLGLTSTQSRIANSIALTTVYLDIAFVARAPKRYVPVDNDAATDMAP